MLWYEIVINVVIIWFAAIGFCYVCNQILDKFLK